MDIQDIKQKIANGEFSDEELSKLFSHPKTNPKSRGGFLKTILKGFIDGYTTPQLYRAIMETILILLVVVGVVLLTWIGRLDTTLCAVFLSLVLGYLFGKTR